MTGPWRPSREEIAAAYGRSIPNVIAPDLRVLLCGISPSLYSGAVRRHFAGPSNRFWRALHGSGFTDRLLSAFDNRELLRAGLGVTNLVNRATATADDLFPDELREGARRLEKKVRRYRPAFVAVVGIGDYGTAFGRPRSKPGPQPQNLADARLWVLPNTSGRAAAYQLPALIEHFARLRRASRGAANGR